MFRCRQPRAATEAERTRRRAPSWAVAVVIVLVAVAAHAASKSSVGFLIEIREAVQVEQQGSVVRVAIRLDKTVSALVWRGADCKQAGSGAQSIQRSGVYDLSLSQLGDSRSPSVCLLSSDGRLAVAVPVVDASGTAR